MLCFLQKAHHHRNPDNPVNINSGSLLRLNFSTKRRTDCNDFFVRLLYGDIDTSQQNSKTAASSLPVKPASSNTAILFDFPKILSYNVPFGMP